MHLSDPPTLKELEELRFQLCTEKEEAIKVFTTGIKSSRLIESALAIIDQEIALLKI